MFTRFRDCQKFQIVKPDIDLSHYAVTSQLGRERNAEVRVAPVTSPKLVVDDQYRTRACLCACARERVCVFFTADWLCELLKNGFTRSLEQ